MSELVSSRMDPLPHSLAYFALIYVIQKVKHFCHFHLSIPPALPRLMWDWWLLFKDSTVVLYFFSKIDKATELVLLEYVLVDYIMWKLRSLN